MTQVFTDGFESNDYTAWTGTAASGGSIAPSTEQAKEGTYSSKSILTGTGSVWAVAYKGLTASGTFYLRVYVYFLSLPGSGSSNWICDIRIPSWPFVQAGVANVAGTIKWRMKYRNNAGTWFAVDYTPGPATGQWYCVEIKYKKGTTAGEARMYVDGVEIATITNNDLNTDASRIEVGNALTVGDSADATTQYIDSVIVDNANYIGPIAAGWTHKILGIANASISKINGVAKANIAKVNGV